jgi:lipopolysaccharide transport system ATP-binding protein
MNTSINFNNVSKRYRIGQPTRNLKSLVSSLGRSRTKEKYHWAVKDISFELSSGDAMGIIGPNGAGKTTILKLLSKITFPTSGRININGRLSALIELGAGFHPELSGRENIYLNGSILGMRREEVKKRFDQIVEFSGIEEYLDTPVKRYSSGMYARLGYSVAAHVDPEILLVDEVLAVGDMAFQKKCYEHMRQLIQKGMTVILVSHNLQSIQRVCSECAVLYRGNKVFHGSSAEAVAEYSNILRNAASEYTHSEGIMEKGLSQQIMTHAAVIQEVEMLREDGTKAITFQSGENVVVQAKIRFNQAAHSPIFACTVRQPDGQIAYDFTTAWAEIETPDFSANNIVNVQFPLTLNLAAGTYHLGVNFAYHDLSLYYDRMDRALDFVIVGGNGSRGVANLDASFRIADVQPVSSGQSVD